MTLHNPALTRVASGSGSEPDFMFARASLFFPVVLCTSLKPMAPLLFRVSRVGLLWGLASNRVFLALARHSVPHFLVNELLDLVRDTDFARMLEHWNSPCVHLCGQPKLSLWQINFVEQMHALGR